MRPDKENHFLYFCNKNVEKLVSSDGDTVYSTLSGADPGFLLGGGAPLRNSVTDW